MWLPLPEKKGHPLYPAQAFQRKGGQKGRKEEYAIPLLEKYV